MFDHLARGVYSDTAIGNYTCVCTDSINNVTQPLKLTDLSAWSCSFISSSTFLQADQALKLFDLSVTDTSPIYKV